jgi:hypothetical protein
MPLDNLTRRVRGVEVRAPQHVTRDSADDNDGGELVLNKRKAARKSKKAHNGDDAHKPLIDIDDPQAQSNGDDDEQRDDAKTLESVDASDASASEDSVAAGAVRYRTPEVPSNTFGFDRQPAAVPSDVQV